MEFSASSISSRDHKEEPHPSAQLSHSHTTAQRSKRTLMNETSVAKLTLIKFCHFHMLGMI